MNEEGCTTAFLWLIYIDLYEKMIYPWSKVPTPPKQILYKSSNLIKNINAQCLRGSILLYSQKGIVLICLWRVQGCSGRGETPARCSCSGCLGSPESLLHPPCLYLPLKLSEFTNTLQLDMGGGLWNFGMFIVDLVSAVSSNRCLTCTNTIIPQNTNVDRNILGFFLKSANTNNRLWWLSPACGQLTVCTRKVQKGDIKEGLLRLKWFNWASLNTFLVRFYLAVGGRLPFFQFGL